MTVRRVIVQSKAAIVRQVINREVVATVRRVINRVINRTTRPAIVVKEYKRRMDEVCCIPSLILSGASEIDTVCSPRSSLKGFHTRLLFRRLYFQTICILYFYGPINLNHFSRATNT
jgi:hypothetical protein